MVSRREYTQWFPSTHKVNNIEEFTIDIQPESKLPLLDVLLQKLYNGTIKTKIYIKPIYAVTRAYKEAGRN